MASKTPSRRRSGRLAGVSQDFVALGDTRQESPSSKRSSQRAEAKLASDVNSWSRQRCEEWIIRNDYQIPRGAKIASKYRNFIREKLLIRSVATAATPRIAPEPPSAKKRRKLKIPVQPSPAPVSREFPPPSPVAAPVVQMSTSRKRKRNELEQTPKQGIVHARIAALVTSTPVAQVGSTPSDANLIPPGTVKKRTLAFTPKQDSEAPSAKRQRIVSPSPAVPAPIFGSSTIDTDNFPRPTSTAKSQVVLPPPQSKAPSTGGVTSQVRAGPTRTFGDPVPTSENPHAVPLPGLTSSFSPRRRTFHNPVSTSGDSQAAPVALPGLTFASFAPRGKATANTALSHDPSPLAENATQSTEHLTPAIGQVGEEKMSTQICPIKETTLIFASCLYVASSVVLAMTYLY